MCVCVCVCTWYILGIMWFNNQAMNIPLGVYQMSMTWPLDVLNPFSWNSNIFRHHVGYLYYKVEFCLFLFILAMLRELNPRPLFLIHARQAPYPWATATPLFNFIPEEIEVHKTNILPKNSVFKLFMRFHKLAIEKREVVQLLRHLVDLLISRTYWNTGEDKGNNEFFGKTNQMNNV